jgi:hypothetical protein
MTRIDFEHDVVAAHTTFTTMLDGRYVTVRRDQLVRRAHPVVERHPEYFQAPVILEPPTPAAYDTAPDAA